MLRPGSRRHPDRAGRASPLTRGIFPLNEQDIDLAAIDIVVNTHLHFDHCGGNHLFADKPVYVQRLELDEPRTEGQLRVRALHPEQVWLAHGHEPWDADAARLRRT